MHNTLYIIYFPDRKLFSVNDHVLLVNLVCSLYEATFVHLNIQCPPSLTLWSLTMATIHMFFISSVFKILTSVKVSQTYYQFCLQIFSRYTCTRCEDCNKCKITLLCWLQQRELNIINHNKVFFPQIVDSCINSKKPERVITSLFSSIILQ